MVAVQPVQRIDMQRDAAMGRQRLEELAHQLGVERADLRRRHLDVPDQVGPAGEIQRGAHQRIIHRQKARAIPHDPALVAQRLGQSLAQRDAGIFDRVVIVDMQIARRPHGHVDQRMPRQLVQHVIEEPDAGLVVIDTRPVEVDLDRDIGFRRLAADAGTAHVLSPSTPRL